ncbi:MAG TPA: trypsin-like peptidase domain-containing protein [Candidatus Dormibacteraeota bacterium]|nr:trypsin-like peptidase domain-containing protein [Candidatus Dormibacteraeota bacterium]
MGFVEELEAAAATVREKALPAVVGVGSRWPSGSGIVFADGLVVTSAHNVHSDTPQVHFADGARREATSVTADVAGDLAVLKVPTEGVTVVKWAAGDPQLGTPVFAAANPGGRGPRLSFGVVSAQDREFRGPGGHPITGGFEHTAPLPHGSSGGPVLNLAGELVGINTKRLGEGLYAALEADAGLLTRLEALGKGETVVRPYLGVGLLPGEVARQLRAAVGLPERNGVLVQHLDEQGPAAQAGVMKGDLLTKANDSELSRASDLHRALASSQPGDQIQLELVRGAEEKRIGVTLGTEPERAERETRHRNYHRRR